MKHIALLLLIVATVLGFTMLDFESPDQPAQEFGGNRVTQVGIVVHDVEQAAQAYAELLGMDVPEIIITDPVEMAHTEYQGKSTEARARLAFFRMDNIQIELIEPVGGPSTWKEFLDTHGEGVHHIAFQVEGMDEHIALLESKGGELVQRGDFTGGSYSYVDTTPQLGTILELLTSTN